MTVTELEDGFTAASVNDGDENQTGTNVMTLSNVPLAGGGMTFTNTRQVYDVTVKNTVSPDAYGDKTKSFLYTATLWKGDNQFVFPTGLATGVVDGVPVSLSRDRRTLTFSLKHDDKLTVRSLPSGYRLVVTQSPDEYFETTAVGTRTAGNSTVADADTENGSIFIIGSIPASVTIDFANKLKTGDYTVLKNVQLPEGKTVPDGTSFSFTAKLLPTAGATTAAPLSQEIKTMVDNLKNVNGNSLISAACNEEDNTIRFTLADKGRVTLTGLPAGYFLQVTETAPGWAAYVSGIRTNTATQQIKPDVRNGSISFINREAQSFLAVRLVDEENYYASPSVLTPLSGGQFRLSKWNGEAAVPDLTSDNDGFLAYTESGTVTSEIPLENGTYNLVETKAPAGYNKIAGSVRIRVDDKEENVIQYSLDDGVTYLPLTPVKMEKTDDSGTFVYDLYTLVLTNKTGVDVRFRKLDSFGNPQNGAAFKLYSDVDCTVEVEKVPPAESKSQESEIYDGSSWTGSGTYSGIVTLEMVPNGIYYMMETAAPAGYRTGDRFVVVVGEEYMTRSDDPVWGSGGVLERNRT